MRFNGLALAVSALVLAACGGGDKNADTAAAAAPTDTAATAQAPATTPSTTPAAGAAAAVPVTGKWIEVKMIGDDKGYRFEPADITLKQGDGIKFVMVSGGPHNVAFNPTTLPADVKAQLAANMPNQIAELSSPMFMNPNETYELSLGGVKPGTYDFHCTPHLAMGMKGKITVQ